MVVLYSTVFWQHKLYLSLTLEKQYTVPHYSYMGVCYRQLYSLPSWENNLNKSFLPVSASFPLILFSFSLSPLFLPQIHIKVICFFTAK